MMIKHYHNLAQSIINRSRGNEFPPELHDASKTLMAMILDAKEKHGFDFYTAMEKDEPVRK